MPRSMASRVYLEETSEKMIDLSSYIHLISQFIGNNALDKITLKSKVSLNSTNSQIADFG